MLKVGTLVILVATDGYMPPLGACGEVVGFDGEDYEVLFPRHPCPAGPEPWWFAAPSMLMPVGGDYSERQTQYENTLLA